MQALSKTPASKAYSPTLSKTLLAHNGRVLGDLRRIYLGLRYFVMQYYFAYGSNMDQEQMSVRCPSAELVSIGKLLDYRLAFTIFSPKRNCGCADIISSVGDQTYGLVYKLSDHDMLALDTFEGSPIHYHRIPVSIVTDLGIVVVNTYEVVTKQENLLPSTHYLGLIQTAAKLHSFPLLYQARLAEVEVQK